LTLTPSHTLLLAVAWVTDKERKLAEMYPEFFFMDVTSWMNNEGWGLFLMAGKDGNASAFTATRSFLPSEQRSVFHWIFWCCLPELVSENMIKANKLSLTDGDTHAYQPLQNLMSFKNLWVGQHALCE